MANRWSRPMLVALTSAGIVAVLVLAGRFARDWLSRRGHYDLALADIQCASPPGLNRAEFLAQVQYLGSLPDYISSVDPALSLRLAAAFAAHPWVAQVHRLALRGPGGPRVDLLFRTPSLVVQGRVLDAEGILLPDGAPADGVIVYRGKAPAPKGPAGSRYGDPQVEEIARIAGRLAPFQSQLRLHEVNESNGELSFTGGVRLDWGPIKGSDEKLTQLQERLSKTDTPPEAIDLRR